VVGITTAVLGRRRLTAFAAVATCVVVWSVVAPHLDPVSKWPTIAIASLGVIPGTLLLVLIALPLWSQRWLLPAAFAFAGLAIVLWVIGWHLPANFAKLGAAVCVGWAFLWLFERLSWVLLVAVVVPFVDLISVWRGPTHSITTHHFSVYTDVAIAFPLPGGDAYSFGPPDILFFALFLGAAARWQLRTNWTWAAMTAMYSSTVIIATTTSVHGLAGLPFLSFGFLVANIDLLWRAMRSAGSSGSSPVSS
jgi:hypothetical protein